jgi:hypothetical protein
MRLKARRAGRARRHIEAREALAITHAALGKADTFAPPTALTKSGGARGQALGQAF